MRAVASGVRPAHRAGGRPRAAFAVLGAVQVTLIATITVVTVALPAIGADLGLARGGLVLVSSGYGLAFGVLLLPAGRVADRRGHRGVLMAGLAVFGVGSAAAGLAPAAAGLVAARLAEGVGAALTAPAALAAVRGVFTDPAARTRALAGWGVLSSAGAVLGTVVSGPLLAWVSWRWLFAGPVLVATTALVAVPRLLPPAPHPRTAAADVAGAAAADAAGTAAADAAGTAAGEGWGGWARALLALASRRALPLTAVLLGSAVLASMFFLLALSLQQAGGLSPTRTSVAFLPALPALAAAGPLAGWLLPRLGPGRLAAVGLFGAAAGLGVLGLSGPRYAGLLIAPLGTGLAFAAGAVAVTAEVPPGQAGLAGGLLNTAMEVGPPLGLAVLAQLVAGHAGDTAAYRTAAGGCLAVALLTLTHLGRPAAGGQIPRDDTKRAG